MYTAPRPWRICWSLFASWFLACSNWSSQIQKLRSTKKSSQTRMGSLHTYLPVDEHSCREMASMRNKVLNELDTPQITYRSNFAGFQQSCTRNGWIIFSVEGGEGIKLPRVETRKNLGSHWSCDLIEWHVSALRLLQGVLIISIQSDDHRSLSHT